MPGDDCVWERLEVVKKPGEYIRGINCQNNNKNCKVKKGGN